MGAIKEVNSILCYRTYGTGSKKLLAFHGYGQDGHAFSIFQRALEGYTLYAFDLFLFGESEWKEENTILSAPFWQNAMRTFFKSEGIVEFDLMGFSIGAKLALITYEQFSHHVGRLILIAPDGISLNPWYRLATRSALARSFLRYSIYHPAIILQLVQLLRTRRLIGTWKERFIIRQMETLDKRKRVYAVWDLYRGIRPSIQEIGSRLKEDRIQTILFLGVADKIIGRSTVLPLIKMAPHIRLVILRAGHTSIVNRSAQWLEDERP